MADEFISGNERYLDPAGRGIWTDPLAPATDGSIFDSLFDFASSTFSTAVDWYGTDRAYELERLRTTTRYDDRTALGAIGSGNMQTVLILGMVGVGLFLLVKAVR